MRKRKTGALAVLLVFMMAFANIFGMMPAISVAAQEEKQQEVTVERASELVYGEQYLLVGGTAGKTSGSEDDLYAVVGATTHSGSKAGSVLDKVEVSGLDFSDAENQLTAQKRICGQQSRAKMERLHFTIRLQINICTLSQGTEL